MKKLTVEKTAGLSMELIAVAGDANGLNLTALRKAKGSPQSYVLVTAKRLLQEATEQLTNVHQIHAEIIQNEAAGIEPYINTLFIHVQDHFANALVYHDLSQYLVNLYEKINEMKDGNSCECQCRAKS